ncbi:hypothetical protein QE430_002481 [Microbacterium testaceum]|uniref:hypothetical protein n=1 Tax=Microbacterium testaceum TaxID=2033 RepID=UPI00277E5163|nr:hypothetical protein [Microbacterium testaceum]MDQ1174174.1 hypothetical protein [Microbacterium testaceum]
MAARTIKLGSVVYTDVTGRPTAGYLGEDVDVHEDDLERFDRLNVVPDVVEVAAAAPTQTDIDEAVRAAVEAKDAELAEAREAIIADAAQLEAVKVAARAAIDEEVAKVNAAKEELAREREAFEAEKAAAAQAEPEKKTAARAPKAQS